MKRLLFLVIFASTLCNAQNYFAFCPAILNKQGIIDSKFCPTLEMGRQIGALSLGVDFGYLNICKKDTSAYIEFRPNLNIFQQGKFSNTVTIGIGYIFNVKNNILTELSTGIEYTPNKRFSYNIFLGTYYISNLSPVFWGCSIMYYFDK